MFAIVKTGGHQYRVQEGDKLTIGRVAGDVGATVTFDSVIAVGKGSDLKLGGPFVSGAAVKAEILTQNKSDTIIIFKKKRRQNYRRRNGHRQEQTIVQIKSITA